MKAADFSRKVRAPRRSPKVSRKPRAEHAVEPERGSDSVADSELPPALATMDAPADRGEAGQNSVEDPLADWPEGGSSGNDEWLRERNHPEGSSSS